MVVVGCYWNVAIWRAVPGELGAFYIFFVTHVLLLLLRLRWMMKTKSSFCN